MKQILTLFIIFLTLGAFAQEYNNFMSISMGGAISRGDFASTDASNPEAGYAESSFSLSFDGAYFFVPNLGIGGSISFLNNAVNQTSLREDIISDIEEKYPDFKIPDDSVSFSVGAWNHVNFLVGPHVTAPLGRVSIDLRVLGGISWVFPPPAELYVATEELDYRIYWDQRQSVVLAYDLGGGIRFDSGNNYIIRLGIDYIYKKATFQITDQISTPDDPDNTETREHTQPLGTIQAMVGIGYYF